MVVNNEDEPKSIWELPGPQPSLPVFGTTWIYYPFIGHYQIENLHEANIDKYRRYGKICREEFSYKHPCVQVYDPEDIEKVLRNQGRFPSRPANEAAVMFRKSHPELYNSVGIVNAADEEWHRLRNGLAGQLIQPRVVNAFIAKQNMIADDFIDLLEHVRQPDGTVENVLEALHRMALESGTMFCLDTRLGCLSGNIEEGSDARKMIDASLNLFQAYQSLYYGSQLWRYFTTAAYQQMVDSELTLYSVVSKHIKEAKKQNQNSVDDCPSVVQLLTKEEGIDVRDIHAGIVDLITAGIDTTANTLSFVLNQLAENPHVQEKLYEEIKNTIGDGEADVNTLSELPYLKACIKETFRICPTIPNIVRILTTDTVLSGFLIPKGTTVMCQTMVTSQLSDFVEEADKFLPERWLPDYPTKCKSFIIQPFGTGPRMCPGRRFAEQEMYLILIKIIQKYRIELVNKMELQYLFIITPKAPVTFKFISRT